MLAQNCDQGGRIGIGNKRGALGMRASAASDSNVLDVTPMDKIYR
jgi:hypothetical protein